MTITEPPCLCTHTEDDHLHLITSNSCTRCTCEGYEPAPAAVAEGVRRPAEELAWHQLQSSESTRAQHADHATILKQQEQLRVLADALRLIAGPAPHCESFTGAPFCRDTRSGRTLGAAFGADAWCAPCIAADALTRLGAAT